MSSGEPAGVHKVRGPVRHRIAVALMPRATRAQAVIGLLGVLLGFGLALQVRATAGGDALSTAREADLVRILDDLTARNERLAAEERDLQETRDELSRGGDTTTTALRDAQQRADTLGVLAGTVAATGPGVVVTMTDPDARVDAATLLDAVEELRDAGAEAVDVSGVRVVAQTAFVDDRPGSLRVDGHLVRAPYTITAIGDPRTMSAALRIPGGVVETVRGLGGDAVVDERDSLRVRSLRPASTPQYARPASSP